MEVRDLLYRKDGGISKLKLGAVLVAAAPVLTVIGRALTGEVDILTSLKDLLPLVGGLLAAVGLRDALGKK